LKDAFEQGSWGKKFPTVVGSLVQGSGQGDSIFTFAPEVGRLIYTTNVIESVNARLRKILKTRGLFPSEEAATMLIWLALRNIAAA